MNLQRVRVPLGFVYAAAFLYWAVPRPRLLLVGVVVAAAGLAVRVWASGYLNKGRVLATEGPYSRTRNPLYFGSFIMGLGFTLSGSNAWLLGAFLVLFFLIYLPVMKREEAELESAFGERFRDYREHVPLFMPAFGNRARPVGLMAKGNFQWAKVISNREYKAVIGFLLIAALMWGKMIWK